MGTEDIKAYPAVRTCFLGAHRPASMLLIIPKLVWPELLGEIEILTARRLGAPPEAVTNESILASRQHTQHTALCTRGSRCLAKRIPRSAGIRRSR